MTSRPFASAYFSNWMLGVSGVVDDDVVVVPGADVWPQAARLNASSTSTGNVRGWIIGNSRIATSLASCE